MEFDDFVQVAYEAVLVAPERPDDVGCNDETYVANRVRWAIADWVRTFVGRPEYRSAALRRRGVLLQRKRDEDDELARLPCDLGRYAFDHVERVDTLDAIDRLLTRRIARAGPVDRRTYQQERDVFRLLRTGMTHARVGDALGVTEARISQVLRRIKDAVRESEIAA